MKINYRGPEDRQILEISDARIVYRNFEGRGDKFNRPGERNFAVIIPTQEQADELIEKGWNVKIKDPREGYDDPFMFLPVKVKYNENGRGPAAYVKSGTSYTKLDEDSIAMLDDIDIASVDMDIRPYDWTVNGSSGRTAYLQAINVTQNIDRFGAMYAAQDGDMPF